MTAVSRRAQVVFGVEEYALIEDYARERGVTVSALLREVVGEALIAQLRERRRDEALARLFAQNLPTADWEELEQDLAGMYKGHEPA